LSNTLAGSACHVARGGRPEAGAAAGGARGCAGGARRADQIARHAEEFGKSRPAVALALAMCSSIVPIGLLSLRALEPRPSASTR
jgi:hypothetical protein